MTVKTLNRRTNTVHKLVREKCFASVPTLQQMNEYVKITGDPILRHRAAEVPLDKIKSTEIVSLIKQMQKVLRSYNLVGLAAPQIGVPARIIVLEASEQLKEKYPAAIYKARGCEVLPMTVSD